MDNLGMKRQILDYVLEGEIRTKEGLNEYLWGRKWEGNFFGPTIRKGWRQEVRDDHSGDTKKSRGGKRSGGKTSRDLRGKGGHRDSPGVRRVWLRDFEGWPYLALHFKLSHRAVLQPRPSAPNFRWRQDRGRDPGGERNYKKKATFHVRIYATQRRKQKFSI